MNINIKQIIFLCISLSEGKWVFNINFSSFLNFLNLKHEIFIVRRRVGGGIYIYEWINIKKTNETNEWISNKRQINIKIKHLIFIVRRRVGGGEEALNIAMDIQSELTALQTNYTSGDYICITCICICVTLDFCILFIFWHGNKVNIDFFIPTKHKISEGTCSFIFFIYNFLVMQTSNKPGKVFFILPERKLLASCQTQFSGN